MVLPTANRSSSCQRAIATHIRSQGPAFRAIYQPSFLRSWQKIGQE